MRRLLASLALSVMMLFAVAGPAMAVAADDEPVGGLEPAEANDPDNDFAPGDYEGNFLWGGLGVGLLFLVGAGFAGVGGLYYVMVVKPSQASS